MTFLATARPRVLFAISSMEAGGAERQVATLLQHVDRQRIETLLYLQTRSGPFLANLPADLPIFVFSERSKPSRFYWPGAIHRRQVSDLQTVLREQRVDVLYERTCLQTLIGAPAVRGLDCRRIAVMASNPKDNLPLVARRFVGLKRRLLRKAYQTADLAISVSEGVCEAAVAYYDLPRSTFEVSENHIDLANVDRLADEPVPQPLLDGDHKHILAVGRLVAAKGFDTLLNAVSQLPSDQRQSIQVHILGDGPELATLSDQAAQLRLTMVHFHGHIENPFSWMKAADLLCLSSRYEGSPNVLIESMACGLPIVAFDCRCGPRELLDGGRYGRLVRDGDTDALAQSISEELNTSRDSINAQLEQARAHVESHYSLEAGVARFEGLVDRVLSPRSSQ
jgi:glycosyltransferase involved in cell wall biosynthesis